MLILGNIAAPDFPTCFPLTLEIGNMLIVGNTTASRYTRADLTRLTSPAENGPISK